MTEAEKNAMRARIFGMPSPIFVFFSARSVVSSLIVLVVLVSTGTAYAAQGALPGDPLYKIKISVNEQIETALAATPVQKAHVQAALATRRVEEAEVLAERGALDATTTAALAANFEAHAQNAKDLTEDIAEDYPAESAQIKTEFDSSLRAHGAILAVLSEKGVGSTKEGAREPSARALARADVAVRAPRASEPASTSEISISAAASTTATTAGKQKAVAGLELKVSVVLNEAREHFADVRDKLDATTTAQVAARFSEIEALVAQGAAASSGGDTGAAASSYAKALGLSIKLGTTLEAQQKFRINILTPVLKLHDEDSGPGKDNAEFKI